jgi:hypothetical protein
VECAVNPSQLEVVDVTYGKGHGELTTVNVPASFTRASTWLWLAADGEVVSSDATDDGVHAAGRWFPDDATMKYPSRSPPSAGA